jgi:hypothetical protein
MESSGEVELTLPVIAITCFLADSRILPGFTGVPEQKSPEHSAPCNLLSQYCTQKPLMRVLRRREAAQTRKALE